MKLPISFIVTELALKDASECIEWLERCGATLTPDRDYIDCKQSVATVAAAATATSQ